MKGRLKILMAVAGCIMVGLLLSLGIPSAGAQNIVNIGTLGLLADGPVYIALERGYFKEMGIDAKLQYFAGGAEMMAPLAAGHLQATADSGYALSMFNGILRGMPIKLVASTANMLPGYDGQWPMLRPDLKDKVRTIADLKGRKVAINTPGSPLLYSLGKILESGGLTLKDIDLVYMPFPDMGTALKNKAIDVGFTVEPFVTFNVERGFGLKWIKQSDVINKPYQDIAGVALNSDWGEKNKELGTNFMVGWLKGAREYVEASLHRPNRKEVVGIMIKHTRIKDPALYDKMEWMYVSPNGFVNEASVADQIKWYFDNGFLSTRIPIDRVVDNSYLGRAIEKIGRLPEPPLR